MRMSTVIALVAVLILGTSAPVFAWGPAGHKIVASIAFLQLTPAEQKKVADLLASHPRFDEDFTDKMPDDVSTGDDATKREWLFQQAAIWPDLARGFQAADKAEYHRPSWHYINKPLFLTPADKTALESTISVNVTLDPPATANKDMNVIQAIRIARSTLTDTTAEDEAKAVSLAWLFHTVGDVHQPLHSTAMFSRNLFPNGDRGGNSVKTTQRGNLHSLWDGLPGGNIKFTTVRNRALTLVNDSALTAIRTNAATDLNEATWMNESFDSAKNSTYDAEVVGLLKQLETMNIDIDQHPIKLSDQYLKTAGEIVERRLLEAGIRLGKVLKEVVAD